MSIVYRILHTHNYLIVPSCFRLARSYDFMECSRYWSDIKKEKRKRSILTIKISKISIHTSGIC